MGEKGVGRFASHRLGKNLIIKTKIEENNYEYVLKIDWDDFNFTSGLYLDLSEISKKELHNEIDELIKKHS